MRVVRNIGGGTSSSESLTCHINCKITSAHTYLHVRQLIVLSWHETKFGGDTFSLLVQFLYEYNPLL